MERENQLLVANEVTTKANDQGQMIGQTDAVQVTYWEVPETVLVDADYSNEGVHDKKVTT